MFLGFKRGVKDYKIRDLKDKKILLSRDVTFDEVSMMKLDDSQQVESKKTTRYRSRWRVMLLHVLQIVQYRLRFH